MMPICYADRETPYLIKKIGGKSEVKTHLENLGFHVGSEVRVINEIDGNLIIKVKETRVAVSSELAKKIMV